MFLSSSFFKLGRPVILHVCTRTVLKELTENSLKVSIFYWKWLQCMPLECSTSQTVIHNKVNMVLSTCTSPLPSILSKWRRHQCWQCYIHCMYNVVASVPWHTAHTRHRKVIIGQTCCWTGITYFVMALNTPLMQAICRATNASVKRTPLSSWSSWPWMSVPSRSSTTLKEERERMYSSLACHHPLDAEMFIAVSGSIPTKMCRYNQ